MAHVSANNALPINNAACIKKAKDETGLTEEQGQSFIGQLNRKGKNLERRQTYPLNPKASSEMGIGGYV